MESIIGEGSNAEQRCSGKGWLVKIILECERGGRKNVTQLQIVYSSQHVNGRIHFELLSGVFFFVSNIFEG